MKITIVFGFLGSGKTTLLRHLLPQLARRERIALLVNEFGEVGIDGELLSTGDLQVKEMASGCICCSLVGDTLRALQQIHEGWDPERLIIEPTGIAAPQPLMQILAQPQVSGFAVLDRIVTVVDAPRFLPSREIFADFYVEQVRHAHALVLNKVDEADPEDVQAVADALREENPRAPIEATTFGRVPLEWLMGDGRPVTGDGGEHVHVEDSSCGLTSHVVTPGRVGRARLEDALGRLDAGEFGRVVRAKGFVETPEGLLHVEYVPGRYTLEPHAGDTRAFVVVGRGVDTDGLGRALGNSADAPG